MKLEVEMKPVDLILNRHGLQENGPVQKMIDSECMRYMSDYMPRRQAGELEHMMLMSPKTYLLSYPYFPKSS